MALKTELGKQLYRKCRLEARLQNLEQQKELVDCQLPYAVFAKREADFALMDYESGSLRAFLDKLSGKWEDKREALARNLASAETTLRNLQRQREVVQQDLAEVKSEWEAVAGLGDTVEQAKNLEAEEQEIILQRVAAGSVDRLLPLLEKAEKALEEAQEWARPNNRIDVAPGYTKGNLLAKAGGYAKDCEKCLRRIEECGILLEIHPYFENPAGYINGVAAQYAELDRINRALGAIRKTERQAKELLLQLTEEEAL